MTPLIDGLCSAVEKLRAARSDVDSDIAKIVDSLHRKETNLLVLKKAGIPDEVLDACFLLCHCKESLVPERIEKIRCNPIARSFKIRELRALIEQGDLHATPGGRWELLRNDLAHSLDILENGPRPADPSKKKPDSRTERGGFVDLYEETEEMHHVALSW